MGELRTSKLQVGQQRINCFFTIYFQYEFGGGTFAMILYDLVGDSHIFLNRGPYLRRNIHIKNKVRRPDTLKVLVALEDICRMRTR